MKIQRKHTFIIIGIFVVGFGIGLVIYNQIINPPPYVSPEAQNQINNQYIEREIESLPQEDIIGVPEFSLPIPSTPDRSEVITAGKNNPLVLINNKETKTYSSADFDFEIVYPADFIVAREEYSMCYKEFFNGTETVADLLPINSSAGTIVPFMLGEYNFVGQEGAVFSGQLGYKYSPDCWLTPVLSLRILEKDSEFDADSYIDKIIKVYADRRKEDGRLNGEGEGPFKITRKVNGESVLVMRTKAGEGFHQWHDTYFFETEKYLYKLSHRYNQPNLILPRSHDHYVEELREYEFAIRAIAGFRLKEIK